MSGEGSRVGVTEEGRSAMTDETVRRRVGEARAEVERALREIEELAGALDGGAFAESSHAAAKAHLRAALAHLDSLRTTPAADAGEGIREG